MIFNDFLIILIKISSKKDYQMGPDGIMYETVEIPKPENDYLILEFLNKETNAIERISNFS